MGSNEQAPTRHCLICRRVLRDLIDKRANSLQS